MNEQCIAVNKADEVVGTVSKFNAHRAENLILHRAFSVFAFTPERKLLLQRRASCKITFPDLWTNTCCSHPWFQPSEMDPCRGIQRAAIRKLEHEVCLSGISEEEFITTGRFLYKAVMSDAEWGEHEMDYALILKNIHIDRIAPNPKEVSEVRAVDMKELEQWIDKDASSFTPWFRLLVSEGFLSLWWNNLGMIEKHANKRIVKLN